MHAPAIQLREQHPTWGAPYLRIHLRKMFPRKPLPSARTLQRWFAKAGLSSAPSGRRRSENLERADSTHQVWQMDASEFVKLKPGKQVCWLRLVDEFSGAFLWTEVFPVAKWETLPATKTQNSLRNAFRKWGMPERLRVDNGFPWGTPKDLPTDLALWLIGLGIGLIWNQPGCPQKNGVVERSQGISQNWAEPGACQSWRELQERLDEADHIQREEYPFYNGQGRMATFPSLKHSGRRYTRSGENQAWQLQRVWDYLADFSWTRTVSSSGQVTMYRQHYYLGKSHRKSRIEVTFDPLQGEWMFKEKSGLLLQKGAAMELRKNRIVSLTVNPDRQKKAKAG